ncbi:hypothetical protein IGI04_026150, partial [Brassica rapa subsp. trilocularis]
ILDEIIRAGVTALTVGIYNTPTKRTSAWVLEYLYIQYKKSNKKLHKQCRTGIVSSFKPLNSQYTSKCKNPQSPMFRSCAQSEKGLELRQATGPCTQIFNIDAGYANQRQIQLSDENRGPAGRGTTEPTQTPPDS